MVVYIIIYNKTMKYQNEVIVVQLINYVFQEFEYALKVNKLLQHQSQYNVLLHEKMTCELVYMVQFPSPDKRTFELDQVPGNIELDNNASFSLQEKQKAQQQQQPLETQISKKQAVVKKNNKQSTLIVKEQDKGLFALSQPLLTPIQSQLQDEITQVKKHLNFIRRLRRENQDECRRRYEEIMNRKPQELPNNKEYAFDFNGQFLFKKKPIFKKNLALTTNAKSQQIADLINKQTRKQSEEQPQRDELISRGQNASRQGKRALFGNSGKRQVSHLPFIKLVQNTKLSQNLRSASGVDNSRYTFKSSQSRGEQSFKHYSEMQKERTQRLSSLKRNNSKYTDITEEYIDPKPQTQRQTRKQSKTMQKYLKKLCEDRSKQFVTELNKSSNFDRINSPHEYSIQRYYKHNFDEDKQSICQSSLASLRLNRSHIRDLVQS